MLQEDPNSEMEHQEHENEHTWNVAIDDVVCDPCKKLQCSVRLRSATFPIP